MADVEVAGTPEIVKVVARGPAGMGGGGYKWAAVQIDSSESLTVAQHFYTFQQADLTIVAQSDDGIFSVGSSPTPGQGGAIFSTEAGFYQQGAFIGNPRGAASLDAGDQRQRYIHFECVTGGQADLATLNLDLRCPIVQGDGTSLDRLAECAAGTPGLIEAGGSAAEGLRMYLVNGTGTDSVPISSLVGYGMFAVWKSAPA